jgi:hypothetical protein
MCRGEIEHQELDYVRYGTVSFVAALVVHSGKMRGWCIEHNDSEQLSSVPPNHILAHDRDFARCSSSVDSHCPRGKAQKVNAYLSDGGVLR